MKNAPNDTQSSEATNTGGAYVQMTIFDWMQNRKKERYVRRISYDETKPFLLGVHYARRMPCITDAFGLFVNGELIGVCTFGVPASPNLCRGLAGDENKKKVLELNRLVILPEHDGKNMASFLVSHSLKMLREKYGYLFIVSYADYEGWGHVGYVYQATNFLYTGMTKSRTDKKPINGGHSRHYAKGETQRVYRTAKHRYVFLVGDKSDRKKMMVDLRYKTYAYLKGDTHRYDTGNPVSLLEKE